MSEFDNLRQALAASLQQKDCNKARVLAAKLLVRAKTPGEREAVQQAQQRVATCSVSLGGTRKRSSSKKKRKISVYKPKSDRAALNYYTKTGCVPCGYNLTTTGLQQIRK